jgi:hypothetical protein
MGLIKIVRYFLFQKDSGGAGSYLGEALMLSGSLAAVAGAVFFLSERTRAAAAAAAILPSAVAAISSLRIGARIKSGSETSHFQVRVVAEGRWVKKTMWAVLF